MKKMLKLVAVFIFVCYFAIISSSNYYAITIEELQATATNLTYGKSVADAIEYEGDVNWYKFTVSDTGYFQVLNLI